MSTERVIVVGAGCAGLSATYTLKKAGVDVLTLEASDVYGGRCRNVEENGYTFPAGAGFTEPQWHTTQQYIKELGMQAFELPQVTFAYSRNGKYYPVLIGGSTWDKFKFLPKYFRLGFGAFPFRTFFQLLRLMRQIKREIKDVDYANHKYDALMRTSNITTADYVCKHGGWNAMNYVFQPYTGTMILARPQDVSAAHPLALFSLMQGMNAVVGGMGEITTRLYNQVKDCVRFNTPVKKIVLKDNRVIGVDTPDGFIKADHVICAVDAEIARRITPDLPDTIRRTLEKCTYSSSFDCQFVVKKKLDVPKNLVAIMIPQDDNTILSTIFVSALDENTTLVVPFTRGGVHNELSRLSQSDLAKRVIENVKHYIPDFPDEPDYTKIFKYDRAVNLEAPGQFEAVQDLLNHHMDDVKGLYLAGEYLFLVACTEGALLTGQQAAEKVAGILTPSSEALNKETILE
jgi:monoamine oxidase